MGMWNCVQVHQLQSFRNKQVKLVAVLPACDICYITVRSHVRLHTLLCACPSVATNLETYAYYINSAWRTCHWEAYNNQNLTSGCQTVTHACWACGWPPRLPQLGRVAPWGPQSWWCTDRCHPPRSWWARSPRCRGTWYLKKDNIRMDQSQMAGFTTEKCKSVHRVACLKQWSCVSPVQGQLECTSLRTVSLSTETELLRHDGKAVSVYNSWYPVALCIPEFASHSLPCELCVCSIYYSTVVWTYVFFVAVCVYFFHFSL